MSEPPQPPGRGDQPFDPTAPPPQSGPPSYGGPDPSPPPPPPHWGQPLHAGSDPHTPPPPPPPFGQPGPYAAQPGQAYPPPYPGPPGQPPYPGPPGQPPYPGAPGQPPYAMTPPSKGRGGKIALIIGAVVLLLLCLCGGLGAWLVYQVGDEIRDQTGALPTSAPAQTAEPTAPGGADDFDEGDCVVNEGTDDDAQLRKVTCAPGTFEVIAKIPFTTDAQQCRNQFLGAGEGNYDNTYTHDQTPGELNDFVLCLKAR